MGCGSGCVAVDGGPLWQWDSGRVARAPRGTRTVAFARRGESRALVVEADPDGTCGIPNELLRSSGDLLAWARGADGLTVATGTFRVLPRAKPDDYIYTPGEVQTWEDIQSWVREQLSHAGEPGTKWYLGDGAPAIGGRVGDLYLDGETGAYYQYGE